MGREGVVGVSFVAFVREWGMGWGVVRRDRKMGGRGVLYE